MAVKFRSIVSIGTTQRRGYFVATEEEAAIDASTAASKTSNKAGLYLKK
jgi:hypothetical protein